MKQENKLPKNCQKKIINAQEYFKLFCQGSDPFMFYHLLLGKKAKKYMEIQRKIHTENTKSFFINTIKIIKEKKLLNNQEVMSYLYGNICHYYLDLYTHPLIYYKSGTFKKEDKSTYKYNGLHQRIEYNIDLYMIKKREKQPPHQFKIYKNIFKIQKFSKELIDTINESIEKTYHYKNISKKYIASIHYMKLFFKYINHDPTGIKLKIYKLLDKITPKQFIKLEELSYHHDFENNLNYLNLNNQTWNYPWDKNKISKKSFFDLYEIALNESIKTITLVTNMLEQNSLNQNILDELFKNLSYVTGLPCEEKVVMKYFENEREFTVT